MLTKLKEAASPFTLAARGLASLGRRAFWAVIWPARGQQFEPYEYSEE